MTFRLSWIFIHVLAALLGSGCFAGRASPSVLIGLEPSGICTKINPIEVKARSKPEIKDQLKEKTASLGGNYVHLQEVRLNRKTSEYIAKGIAFKCR